MRSAEESTAPFGAFDQSATAVRSGKARATSLISEATHFDSLEHVVSSEVLIEGLGAALRSVFCPDGNEFPELEVPFKSTR